MKTMKRIIIASIAGLFLSASLHAQDQAAPKPAEKTEPKAADAKVSEPKTTEDAAPKAEAKTEAKAEEPKSNEQGKKEPAGKGLVPLANTNKIQLTNLIMKASYTIGVKMAVSVMMDGGDLIDREMVLLGMKDVLYRYMPLLDQDEAEEVTKKFEKLVQEHEAEKVRKEAEDNKTNGLAFLEENKKKEGVVATKSGLQYKILQEGKGESPTENDKVAIHFKAKNIDGIEFSNSTKHPEPMTVPVRSQIKAWREAFLLMKPGSKMIIYASPDLAYGTREVGRGVGPNSTLIFEVEMFKVIKDK